MGLTDAHQLEAFAKSRQPDVIRGDAQLRGPEGALAFLDRLPSLLERCEVPPLALAADNP